MTDKELAEIRARCEAATPGPWAEIARCNLHDAEHIWRNEPFHCSTADADATMADWGLFKHAREDIPKLLAEVERLRGALEEAADFAGRLRVPEDDMRKRWELLLGWD